MLFVNRDEVAAKVNKRDRESGKKNLPPLHSPVSLVSAVPRSLSLSLLARRHIAASPAPSCGGNSRERFLIYPRPAMKYSNVL